MNGLIRPGAILLAVGALLVLAYELLSALDVGKIGDPTDIGGGLIVLAGVALACVGAVLLGGGLLQRRRTRR